MTNNGAFAYSRTNLLRYDKASWWQLWGYMEWYFSLHRKG